MVKVKNIDFQKLTLCKHRDCPSFTSVNNVDINILTQWFKHKIQCNSNVYTGYILREVFFNGRETHGGAGDPQYNLSIHDINKFQFNNIPMCIEHNRNKCIGKILWAFHDHNKTNTQTNIGIVFELYNNIGDISEYTELSLCTDNNIVSEVSIVKKGRRSCCVFKKIDTMDKVMTFLNPFSNTKKLSNNNIVMASMEIDGIENVIDDSSIKGDENSNTKTIIKDKDNTPMNIDIPVVSEDTTSSNNNTICNTETENTNILSTINSNSNISTIPNTSNSNISTIPSTINSNSNNNIESLDYVKNIFEAQQAQIKQLVDIQQQQLLLQQQQANIQKTSERELPVQQEPPPIQKPTSPHPRQSIIHKPDMDNMLYQDLILNQFNNPDKKLLAKYIMEDPTIPLTTKIESISNLNKNTSTVPDIPNAPITTQQSNNNTTKRRVNSIDDVVGNVNNIIYKQPDAKRKKEMDKNVEDTTTIQQHSTNATTIQDSISNSNSNTTNHHQPTDKNTDTYLPKNSGILLTGKPKQIFDQFSPEDRHLISTTLQAMGNTTAFQANPTKQANYDNMVNYTQHLRHITNPNDNEFPIAYNETSNSYHNHGLMSGWNDDSMVKASAAAINNSSNIDNHSQMYYRPPDISSITCEPIKSNRAYHPKFV